MKLPFYSQGFKNDKFQEFIVYSNDLLNNCIYTIQDTTKDSNFTIECYEIISKDWFDIVSQLDDEVQEEYKNNTAILDQELSSQYHNFGRLKFIEFENRFLTRMERAIHIAVKISEKIAEDLELIYNHIEAVYFYFIDFDRIDKFKVENIYTLESYNESKKDLIQAHFSILKTYKQEKEVEKDENLQKVLKNGVIYLGLSRIIFSIKDKEMRRYFILSEIESWEEYENSIKENGDTGHFVYQRIVKIICELHSIANKLGITLKENNSYNPEKYKFISRRVYLCYHLGIIPKLLEHFTGDNNKQLIEFLLDLGIFKKSDNKATIGRAIKEVISQKGILTQGNLESIGKEYHKLNKELLK